jgi:hypothetical protein
MTLEQLVEAYGLEWQPFKDSLEEMDKQAFLNLIERVKRHAEAVSKTEYPNLFEAVVLSILVEHQRELQELKGILLPNQTKTCPRCSRTASIEEFFKGDTADDGVSILCSHCKEALNFVQH